MATITAPPRSIRARALEVPWAWGLLIGESIIVACMLHLVLDVQNLAGQLQFAVFFLFVFPLQVMLGSVRGVGKAVGTTSLVVSVVLAALYVYSRTLIHAQAPPPAGTAAANTVGTIVLGLSLVAVGALGVLLPLGVRKWTVRSFLIVGVLFWLGWFWIAVANAQS